MPIVEEIAVALAVYLGKKLVDKVWTAIEGGKAPVANQSGNLGIVAADQGRTRVGRNMTVARGQVEARVIGQVYVPDSVLEIRDGSEVLLVLITEATSGQAVLFASSVEAGFEVSLVPGIYTFCAFLMDGTADEFLDAEIYAIGFPSTIDLSELDGFNLENFDDIWDVVSDAPLEIRPGGPYKVDLVLIDTVSVPEFPIFFSELLGENGDAGFNEGYDLTGEWDLSERYGHGQAVARAYLVQVDCEIRGLVVRKDYLRNGQVITVEEMVTGLVQGDRMAMEGTSVRVLRGRCDYYLDSWQGTIQDDDLISGYSVDQAGSTGMFTMIRSA